MELAAGGSHTCARTSGGAVYCWGNNSSGQLGIGSTGGKYGTPQQVKGLTGAVELAAGGSHTCARTSGGAVYCWGRNVEGQLGIGTTGGIKSTPQQVKNTDGTGFLSGVQEISAGYQHTCARTSKAAGGAVYCWGNNDYGQLGIGPTRGIKSTPQQVKGGGGTGFLSGVVELATWGGHTCASTSTDAGDAVYCWGNNSSGQLGIGSTSGEYGTPQKVKNTDGTGTGFLSGVVELAARSYHTCARTSAGEVYCWGYNAFGQLGIGTTGREKGTPQKVKGLPVAKELAAGSYHTCARTSAGEVYCWGNNDYGQLGINSTSWALASPQQVQGLTGAVELVAGSEHTCALTSTGEVYCWGNNDYGQLGIGTTGGEYGTPQVVIDNPLVGTVELAAGNAHTCALTSGGAVYCWGRNDSGQLGIGSTGEKYGTPQQVQGLPVAVELAAGRYHTCARTSAGVYCWGLNTNGQLGIGSTSGAFTPQQVKGVGGNGFLSGVVELAAGWQHTCARTSTDAGGEVYCWGSNDYGRLGRGSTGGSSSTPQKVKNPDGTGTGFLSGVVELAAGYQHTCARTSTEAGGEVYCWGSNAYGKLGIGSTNVEYGTPQKVKGPGWTWLSFRGGGAFSGVVSHLRSHLRRRRGRGLLLGEQ